MTTFVLVHGAWSGSSGFRHVRRLLQAAGHEVFTPSLTGIGERAPAQIGQAWAVQPLERQFDDTDEGRWVGARRGAQPLACFTEPVFLAQPLESHPFSRTYVKATLSPESDPGAAALWRAARHAQQSNAWRYAQIATTHMVASNRPAELAALLVEIAGTMQGDATR